MYIITVRYKGKNDSEYNYKLEKAVGRHADSLHTNGRTTTIEWKRKSSKSVDRIITALSKFRRIETTYREKLEIGTAGRGTIVKQFGQQQFLDA